MDVIKLLEAEGYKNVKPVGGGKYTGTMKMLFTTGVMVMFPEWIERRYCYENEADAVAACIAWDGAGDPPGPWIKEKPSNRLGPGAVGEEFPTNPKESQP